MDDGCAVRPEQSGHWRFRPGSSAAGAEAVLVGAGIERTSVPVPQSRGQMAPVDRLVREYIPSAQAWCAATWYF